MITLLLIIIYLSFISLGLPDGLLGAAWPAMHASLSVASESAGIISMIVSGGTIFSSLFSNTLIKRFGTGKVALVSVTMTAVALLGNSLSPSFIWLCAMAIPLGLGAGSVDSALNNFVALHYKASHMSWLHCFWGLGATIGPVILSFFMLQTDGWKKGYFVVSMIQFALALVLLLTMGLWKSVEKQDNHSSEEEKGLEKTNLFKIPGIKSTLLSFVCYSSLEATTGLWASTYLVSYRGVSIEQAARWISLFYVGITAGRFISGFLTIKLSNYTLIKLGQAIAVAGIVCLLLPLPTYFSIIALVLIGLGCAPIFPCMLHDTPNKFGALASQSIMGIQMAFAYVGGTFAPPLLGLVATKTSIAILPYFLIGYVLIMFFSTLRTAK